LKYNTRDNERFNIFTIEKNHSMSEFLIIGIGAIVTGAIILFWFKLNKSTGSADKDEIDGLIKERDTLATEKRVLEEKLLIQNDQSRQSYDAIKEKDANIHDLNWQLSQTITENKNLEEKLQEKSREIEKNEEKLRTIFKNLANEILEEKTKKFTDQNKTGLEEILKPLRDKIRDFEKKVEETYDKESKQRFSLEKEIKNLAELNQQISADAKNLTVALKSDTKKQGNWGELVLERVLESSGLVKGSEYIREVSMKSDQGDVYRPDVIVNLPDNKHIIIDSKVSLISYNDYVNAETLEEREKALRLHLNSIKNHVKLLSDKTYQNLEAFDTPDYVLLFLPIESSFSLAIQTDIEIFNYAWERNVIIVSPTTLLATLKTVASIWKHEKQTQNAIEIARQGGFLYDKFVSFLNDLEKIGSQLEMTKRTYDEAHKKLSSGGGNIIGKVEKLRELGAKTSKELPKNLIDKAEDGG
jgi:DNA recombination protein RmuC